MTAKEALLERVKHLTEAQAEELLRQLPEDEVQDDLMPRSGESLYDWTARLAASIPEEELDRLPSSADIDKVVYGRFG